MNFSGRSYCGGFNLPDVGREVYLFGWVDALRDHGDILFIHLRDQSGIVQIVFSPEFASTEICGLASTLRNEFCITVSGRVTERSKGTENPFIETGNIEVIATDLTILSQSRALPFTISEKAMVAGAALVKEAVSEDLRLQYRYLDLRRPTMQDFLLRKALQKSRVLVQKIKIIVLKPPEMVQALRLGNIDAFIAWEPYPSQAVKKGIGRVILSSGGIWENHPCCVLIADTEFCKKNTETIKKIQAVHWRSCEFINSNREEAIEIGMKYTGMDRDTVLLAVSNIIYSPVMDRNKGLEFVDFLKDLRYIRAENIEMPLSNIFYE